MASSLLVVACGSTNSLDGSIQESFPLDFDSVQIRKQDYFLLIAYLRNVGGGTQKVAKIVVDTQGAGIKDGTQLTDTDFQQRVTLHRLISNSRDDFPPVLSGSIHFSFFDFTPDGFIKGNFDAVFEGGRTIAGQFNGPLIIVDTL